MNKRTDPRDVTTGAHYAAIRIQSEGRDEIVHVRKPLPWMAIDLVAWVTEAESGASEDISAAAAAAAGKGDAAAIRVTGLVRQYQAALEGRLIGELWAHQHYDLESTSAPHATLEDKGIAVYAELYEAGWSPSEIQGLATACVQVCGNASKARANVGKVNAQVDFGEPVDTKTTPTSLRGSNISATQEESST